MVIARTRRAGTVPRAASVGAVFRGAVEIAFAWIARRSAIAGTTNAVLGRTVVIAGARLARRGARATRGHRGAATLPIAALIARAGRRIVLGCIVLGDARLVAR